MKPATWLDLEPWPMTVEGASPLGDAWLSMRTEQLTAPLGRSSLLDGKFNFLVAPAAGTRSYDVEISTPRPADADSYMHHSLRVNVDAVTTAPHVDFEPLAPRVDLLSPIAHDGCLSQLAWTANGDEARADAVMIEIGNSLRFTSCCALENTWIIVAPPETTSLDLSFLDELYSPPGWSRHYALKRITYVDADHQQGYRDFLGEPLRFPSFIQSFWGPGRAPAWSLERDLPAGGRVRASSLVVRTR